MLFFVLRVGNLEMKSFGVIVMAAKLKLNMRENMMLYSFLQKVKYGHLMVIP